MSKGVNYHSFDFGSLNLLDGLRRGLGPKFRLTDVLRCSFIDV